MTSRREDRVLLELQEHSQCAQLGAAGAAYRSFNASAAKSHHEHRAVLVGLQIISAEHRVV